MASILGILVGVLLILAGAAFLLALMWAPIWANGR